ncbi:TBC domain-containing [Cordyceps militaris]|uniref:TBC domain-containing n=1 Tax=Cordyceps militaris TaxID=73501 RepID=A0A2H4SWG5_CORMI|nr:TBC domain-containing [Cordyceps militaris]
MTAPSRFSSVKSATSRPAVVGLRYDKTVAAAPPTTVTPTPRAVSRPKPLQRSPSSSTTTSSSGRSYAASVSGVSLAGTAATSVHGGGPSSSSPSAGPVVVVAPPPRLQLQLLPVVAPPTEQHPALRSPPLLPLDEWKRDSGHGSAVMQDTILEEERLNVVGLRDQDDCFVDRDKKQQQQQWSKHATWAPAAGNNNNPSTAFSGTRRAQSLNGVRPATARAAIPSPSECSTAGAPAKKSACAPTNNTGSPAAARASTRSPLTVIAPLDLRIASSVAASSSSSSSSSPSSKHQPAASVTASDFLSTPSSPPPSPVRSTSRRSKLLSRHGLQRLSFWGGSRDDGATVAHTPLPLPPPHDDDDSATKAFRRWHSVSQLRGGSTTVVGDTSIPGDAAAAAQAHTGPGSTPATPASAKRQPPVPPARSSSRSATMSSPSPDLDRERAADFSPIGVAIPTDSLLDDDFLASLHFSKRGSLMFDLNNIAAMNRLSLTDDDDRSATPTQHSSVVAAVPRPASSGTSCAVASPASDLPAMTPDMEQESQKVRQLYASGERAASLRESARHSYCDRLEPHPEVLTEDDESVANGNSPAAASSVPNSASSLSQLKHDAAAPVRHELADPAGGLEDWDDLDSAMVDRYGFIGTPRSLSRVGTPSDVRSLNQSPRRRNVLTKRDPMGFASAQGGGGRLPGRKASARSLYTQHSQVSQVSFRSSRSVLRQASNLLPQNRNRRWMDEAGDMLTVSPNLQDSVEEARVEKISEALKRKEIERSEKWRRMARVVHSNGTGDHDEHDHGQGMAFDFDTRNPKLIERTWKGIPDRWRAAAWWSFLATSAREHPAGDATATEADITAAFRRLQDRASADDIQIDLDVPRTVSSHVMFRRRYRGGQRLLFRVLHALSLYFPTTGYVQGMASLAATLLCYFDEEKSFVMLVRMWRLRGLERLYEPGFDGLLAALRELATVWLPREVARKMEDLGIDGTAYGTRWYLTLFNLSIPFAAQLRVWDVFLLLGDAARGGTEPPPPPQPKPSVASVVSLPSLKETTQTAPSSGLDVLHATSAALMQALREVLLDADFENAMKALTSWISIKDEDLLMKVAKAEWKTQLKRRS